MGKLTQQTVAYNATYIVCAEMECRICGAYGDDDFDMSPTNDVDWLNTAVSRRFNEWGWREMTTSEGDTYPVCPECVESARNLLDEEE